VAYIKDDFLKEKIFAVLSEHPEGIKASQISQIIGIEKKIISSFLTHKQDEYVINENWEWVPRVQPIMAKLNNRSGAKTFTSKQFNALAKWAVCKTHGDKKPQGTYKTKTGNKIDYDSSYELAMFEYLEEHNLVKEMGGQNLCIEYSSAYREGLSYYPDIVALTNDNHIMIIEIKPASHMSRHTNMEKYEGLSEYCISRGYMYAMIDPSKDFMTYEELRDMPVTTELLELFEELVEESDNRIVCFDKYDVADWYESIDPGCTKKEFDLMVHSLIVYYGWYNKSKYDFEVTSEPSSL
jgi:hypothetical protein